MLTKISDYKPGQHGLLNFISEFIDAGKLISGTSGADPLIGTSGKCVLVANIGKPATSWPL